MFELETERLLLRDWVAEDWPLIWALASDERVTHYQTWLRLRDEQQAREWIAAAIAENEREPRVVYSAAVVLNGERQPVGWLGWGNPEHSGIADVSFGYALLPAFWRQGLMSEAVSAMIRYSFDALGKRSLTATCASSNRASSGVLEKAGLRLIDRYMRRDDDLDLEEEHRRYLLNRDEWLAAR